MNAKYLIDRLREPGTLRSMAVVVFGLIGVTPDDTALNSCLWLATIVLGFISAAMPEKPKVEITAAPGLPTPGDAVLQEAVTAAIRDIAAAELSRAAVRAGRALP